MLADVALRTTPEILFRALSSPKLFRIHTYKIRSCNSFRLHTYEKQGRGGPRFRAHHGSTERHLIPFLSIRCAHLLSQQGGHILPAKSLSLLFHSFALSRFVAPLFSYGCALFFWVSPRKPFRINHYRTLCKNTGRGGSHLSTFQHANLPTSNSFRRHPTILISFAAPPIHPIALRALRAQTGTAHPSHRARRALRFYGRRPSGPWLR
jgi:hypothetical protein